MLKILNSRRKKLLLASLALSVIVIGSIAHQLANPAQGQQISVDEQLTKPRASVTKTVVTPAQTVDAKYFHLALPAGYTAQPNSQPPAGLLYSLTLLKPGADGTLIISIALKPLPDGGLVGDSSYALRISKPAEYQLTAQQVAGDSVKIANDNLSATLVAFWQHAGYLATIGVSSGGGGGPNDNNADLLRALQPLLDAWQWQD